MAFDMGGGSGRCMLADVDSGETFTAARSWSYQVAPNTSGLGYDLDLDDMWRKLGEASLEVMKKAGARPADVLGVAAGSMRNTTVLLDGDNRVLLGTPNQDARGLVEAMMLGAERGAEFFEAGGHWPGPIFTGSRLLWAKSNAPELLDRASRVACLSDWMAFRLCGILFAEKSQAGETILFDHRKGDWAFDLIESLGLPSGIFPGTVDTGSLLGGLTAEAASHLGLARGTPVSAGGADTQSGLLGAGCVVEGDTGVLAGTGMPVQIVTGGYSTDGEGKLWSGRHVVPGLFVLESNGMMTGTVLDWFARIIYPDSSDPVGALFHEAGASLPGGSGIYSTFGARIFDARAVGILFGNLTMSHMVTTDADSCRCHISRALIEGIAYSARANLEQIESAAGMRAERLHVLGGMARSALWTQIVSDVTGRAVIVPSTHEASALGTAICAGVGAGVFTDPVEGARQVAGVGREHAPGENAEKYQRLYDGWKEAYSVRAECDTHMAGLLTMAMFESAPAPSAGEAERPFRPRILITAMMDDAALAGLRGLGEVEYAPWRETMKVYEGGRELAAALEGFHFFITEMDVVDFDALRALPGLKAIVSCRVDPVNVDLAAATAYGVPVQNTPGRNADAVADLAVAFMVMLARRLPRAALFLKEERGETGDLARMVEAYATFKGTELWRKTVGLIGLGSVGSRVARRLRPFGAKVFFFDPGVSSGEGSLVGAWKVTLEELLERSDFVSVHAPANDATRGMMGREQFALMKEGSFFINTARASLADDGALAAALESGRLAGAALDVFSTEPPGSGDRLASRDNVIATPHIGGNTAEVAAHQGAIAAAGLGKLLSGERPDHILNLEVLEQFSLTGPRREPSPGELEILARNDRPKMTS